MDRLKIELELNRKLTESEEKEFNYYKNKARASYKMTNGKVIFFQTCWCGEKLSSNSSTLCNRHYQQSIQCM